jgi:hypothetical protein
MSTIYQGSWATIVALCGDSADSGLPQVNEDLPMARQHTFDLDGTILVSVFPTLRHQISNSTWGTRGWTLQERELSPRCIYFCHDQLYFDCYIMHRCEVLHDADSPASLLPNNGRLLPRLMDLNQFYCKTRLVVNDDFMGFSESPWSMYGMVVGEYCNRNLTNSSDSLRACSAILESLSQNLDKGLLFGLPVQYLQVALRWRHAGQFERRKEFPSWSWVGWKGSLLRSTAEHQGSGAQNASLSIHKAQNGEMTQIHCFELNHTGRGFSPLAYINKHMSHASILSNQLYQDFKSMGNGCQSPIPLDQILFIRGHIIRPSLYDAPLDTMLGDYVYSIKLGVKECRIHCFNEATAEFVRAHDWSMLYILLLSSTSIAATDERLEGILLEWNQDIAYRVGLVGFEVNYGPYGQKFIHDFQPAIGEFALG